MTKIALNIVIAVCIYASGHAQQALTEKQRKELSALIDKYSLARETRDTILLKSILSSDIDQLVSTGEWRNGVNSSVKGMLRSSASNPGKRSLTIHKIRMIDQHAAIIDCKYLIENGDGAARNMWSTFIAIQQKNNWKISAIRNMLPTQ